MRKLVCLLLCLLLSVGVLSACAGSPAASAAASSAAAPSESAAPDESAPASSAAPAESTASTGSDLKVALLSMREMTTPSDLNTLEGVQRLKDERGIDVNVVVCLEVAEYYDQMQACCEEGYDVIYFVYDNFLEAAKELCVQYPDTKFIGLWIDMKGEEVAPNFKALHFRYEQGSFLAGAMAALMSENGKVGFIGGGDNPGINIFLAGYKAGVDYIGNCELEYTYANTFDDPLKGKELANSMFARGVDVVMQAANQTGLGVFEAAQENGKYAVGVDVDQSHYAPENIICSALGDHGYATYDAISQVADGKFNNEQVYYGLQEGMPCVAINEAIVPEDIVAQMKDLEQKIIAGEITIPTTLE